MSTTTTGFNGLTAKGVPALPFWLLIIRGAILVLSLGVLVASAYNLSLFSGLLVGYSGPPGFLIFDSILTFIILGAMLASEFFAPQLYLRLAFVGALILAAIFWLSAWAWAASVASTFYSFYNSYGRGYSDVNAYGASMAAAAALGALVWVLIIVTIVFFTLACMKSPNSSSFSNRSPQSDPEAVHKVENPPQAHVAPVQYQQQQPYQQQPYQQQPYQQQ